MARGTAYVALAQSLFTLTVHSQYCPCNIYSMNHMQTLLALELFFGCSNPVNPMSWVPRAAPKAGKIQDCPTHLEKLILRDSPFTRCIVSRMSRDPRILAWDLENFRATQLYPRTGNVGVGCEISWTETFTLARTSQRKWYQHRFGRGEFSVLIQTILSFKLKLICSLAPGCWWRCIRDVVVFQERNEESRRPPSSQNENLHGFLLCLVANVRLGAIDANTEGCLPDCFVPAALCKKTWSLYYNERQWF